MLARGVVTRVLATILCLGVVAVMLWRIRHGIDYTDEAFYVAMPVRFALGDRPFSDELNVTQTAALLLYPFVKVYTAIVGSATGIILFVRMLFLLFFGLVGWSVYALAATRVPRPAAMLLGAACICFIPYGIASLGYNTISMGLLTLGLFVSARWLLAPGPARSVLRAPLLWAGFAHGAASFAYPTVTLAAVTTALAIFLLASGQRLRATLLYIAGGLGFGVVVSPYLLSAGVAQLRQVFTYTGGEAQLSSANNLSLLLTKFLALQPQLPFGAVVILLAIVVSRRWPTLIALGLPFVPLLARGSLLTGPQASIGYVGCFALFAPLLCLGLRDARTARVLALGIALPSMVAGAALSFTSGNGVPASGVGLFPAAVLAAVVLTIFLHETARRWRLPLPSSALVLLCPAVFVWMLLTHVRADDAYYRDARLPELTARIDFGPFKGLYTTPERKAALGALSADILAHIHGDRALFFYDFPAGYLIAFRRPLAGSVWPFALPSRMEPDARFFREHAKSGELVFRDGPQAGGRTPLDRDVAARCDLIANRGYYSLYVVR